MATLHSTHCSVHMHRQVHPDAKTSHYNSQNFPGCALATSWLSDKRLITSKVYLHRFHEAAIAIQRIARGFLCRKTITRNKAAIIYYASVVCIQKAIRSFLQRMTQNQTVAAVKVQTVFRGWSYRVHSQVFLLTRKIELIESLRNQELAAIEQGRNKEIRMLKQELVKQQSAAALREKGQDELLKQSERIIKFLQRENKKLREVNDAMHSDMKLMYKENKLMERKRLTVGVQGCALDKDMKQVYGQIHELEHICQQCEHQKKLFEAAIAVRDDYIMGENRLGRLFLNTIQKIVLDLEDRCAESDLVYKVEELCLAAYDHSETPGGYDDNDHNQDVVECLAHS